MLLGEAVRDLMTATSTLTSGYNVLAPSPKLLVVPSQNAFS
jgi:hypothetical protein